ncbi:hypothetical protein FLAN108750_03305 [Flavobacterium antarcticum]|uniref:hypothetical protein n=1 Tax=Flavobacterium antarcticum TaxID=271155 RepID=UPI0003B3201A|nr:hypothetical protein [Flavobacterium antarcticum]
MDAKKGVHEITMVQFIETNVRIIQELIGTSTLIDYITITTKIQIEKSNNEIIYTTTITSSYGTSEFGGNSLSCKECYNKSNTISSKGLSVNPIANAAAEFIGDRIKVDKRYNLFNQTKSILPTGSGLFFSGVGALTKTGMQPIILGIELAETYDTYRKALTDFSGRSATYNVFSDGTLKLAE